MRTLVVFIVCGLFYGQQARAQLPLNIEALQVQRGELSIDTGVSFSGYSRWQLQQQWLDTENNAIDAIADYPVPYRGDSLLSTLVVRWGLAPSLEVNAGIRRSWHSAGLPAANAMWQRSNALRLGVNYSLQQRGIIPGLVMNLAWEKPLKSSARPGAVGQGSWHLSNTLWYPLDPVVLSLELNYRPHLHIDHDAIRLKTGGGLSVSPRINFAVNHRVTLIGGLGLERDGGDYRNGRLVIRPRNRIRLLSGAGFRLSSRSQLFVYGSFSSGEENTGSISVNWRFHF